MCWSGGSEDSLCVGTIPYAMCVEVQKSTPQSLFQQLGLLLVWLLVLRIRVKGYTANLGESVGTERLLLETLEGRRQRAKATWDPRLRNDFGWG